MSVQLNVELPKSLSTIVEERIRDAIVDAELAFGQPLSEDGLGLSMGVSRTPLREALTRLQTQGLVTIIPKRGTFVFDPSAADVEQLAAFRLLLEQTGAALCLARAADQTRADMQRALAMMVQARADADSKAYARADTVFHESFFTHCGNSYLAAAYHNVSWRVAALRAHLSVPSEEARETSFGEHEAMIACVGKRRGPALAQLLDRHVMRAAKVYAEQIRNRTQAAR